MQPVQKYILVSGLVFALVFVAHVFRIAAEGLHTLGNPFFSVSSLIALALSVWAFITFKAGRASAEQRH